MVQQCDVSAALAGPMRKLTAQPGNQAFGTQALAPHPLVTGANYTPQARRVNLLLKPLQINHVNKLLMLL